MPVTGMAMTPSVATPTISTGTRCRTTQLAHLVPAKPLGLVHGGAGRTLAPAQSRETGEPGHAHPATRTPPQQV